MDKILIKKKNKKIQGFLCFSKMKMVDFYDIFDQNDRYFINKL